MQAILTSSSLILALLKRLMRVHSRFVDGSAR